MSYNTKKNIISRAENESLTNNETVDYRTASLIELNQNENEKKTNK